MMIHRIRRWFRDPRFLLALAAALIAFAVQSGELGSADTQHRLNSTHSFWTTDPPVFPQEYPEFGVHGRGGRLQSWYGIGQSLLMLPPDILGTYVEKIPLFTNYSGNDPTVRNIIVSYTTNIFLIVLTSLLCFRFLRQLKFKTSHATAGVLALLCATTHLHYTQNMMENNYIFLLTLAGLSYQYEWVQSGSWRALLIGSGALGLNLLTRITTGMDLLAAGFIVLLTLWFEQLRGRALWERCLTYLRTAVPVAAFFLVLDRLYQYHRFGSFFNTYIGVVAREARERDPTLAANYPWDTPFHVGFFGALFSAEKSVFLFDPLLILMILLAAVLWKRFSPVIKAYAITMSLLLLAYVCFYARYTVWSGDTAWGDRYCATTAELIVLLAIPLLLRHRRQVGRPIWIGGLGLLGVSVVIQVASVCFWCSLERYQMETLGHPTFVVGLRLENIAAFALGKMDAWHLTNHAMTEDPWDYVHITTWNFLPFLLKRSGVAPAWVVQATLAAWGLGLAALAGVLWRLRQVLARLNEGPAGTAGRGFAAKPFEEQRVNCR